MGILAVLASLLLLGLFLALAVPAIVVGLAVGSVIYLLAQLFLLPFRLLGGAVALGAGVIVFFAKLALVCLIGLISLAALVVGFLPLLPIVVICLGVWLVLRSARRGRRAATS